MVQESNLQRRLENIKKVASREFWASLGAVAASVGSLFLGEQLPVYVKLGFLAVSLLGLYRSGYWSGRAGEMQR